MKTFRDIKKGDTIYSVFLNDHDTDKPYWNIEEVKVYSFIHKQLKMKDSINSFFECEHDCPIEKLKLSYFYPNSKYLLQGIIKAEEFDKEFFVEYKERGLAANKDCIPEVKRQMINKYIEYAQNVAEEHRKTVKMCEESIRKYDKWMKTIG